MTNIGTALSDMVYLKVRTLDRNSSCSYANDTAILFQSN